MASFYALRIRRGLMELDDVPERWREATGELLEAA